MRSSETLHGRATQHIYYIVAGAGDGHRICSDDRYSDLCDAISTAASKDGGSKRLLAYCVDHLWLRVIFGLDHARGVGGILRAISDEYALRAALQQDVDRAPFLFAAIQYVRLRGIATQLAVLRHCHLAPAQLGYVSRSAGWRWSSHRAYAGVDHVTGLHRGTIASPVAHGPGGWPLAYRCLTAETHSTQDAVLLPNMLEIRILPHAHSDGDRSCLDVLRQLPAGRDLERMLWEAVDDVCATTGCDPEPFMARPWDRQFRLERALLLDRMMAGRRLRRLTVDQLAARLKCDRSALYHTRKELRFQFPDLFENSDEGKRNSAKGRTNN